MCHVYFSFSQIVTKLHEVVRNLSDIAATNRIEIAASLHLRNLFIANSGVTKIPLKTATKIAPKIAGVNGPLRTFKQKIGENR